MSEMFQSVDNLVDEIKSTTNRIHRSIFSLPKVILGIILISGVMIVIKNLI